jgi:hypothetical protein
MDDPMVRLRLSRITGTRSLGLPIPSGGPFFFARFSSRLLLLIPQVLRSDN